MNKRLFLQSLFENYQRDLQRFIAHKFGYAHDAEDIVQDAFHNMLRAADDAPIENPRAYLYQTANNLALNRIRKHKRHTQYLASTEVPDEADEVASPHRTFHARRDLEKLQQALAGLAPKYRRTFLLSRVEEMTYKEISIELNMPLSTVEKHMIKVLQHLRDHLGDDD